MRSDECEIMRLMLAACFDGDISEPFHFKGPSQKEADPTEGLRRGHCDFCFGLL